MKHPNRSRIAAAMIAGAALFIHPASASDFPEGSPAFVTAYDAALKAAKDGGKPVVMIFSASWCPPCQANKRRVYPSAEVKPFHDKFVWAYLDADQKANAAAMQKFGVSGIPHIEFLDKEGRSLGQAVGGTAPEAFAGQLAAILKKAGS
jgi:thiol:disulfide interchange protein